MFNTTHFRIAIVLGIAPILAFAFVTCRHATDPQMVATGRRPLVIASGVTEQLPTGDWLTSAGGIATDGTTPVAGDLRTATATISTSLTTGALVGTVQASTVTGTQNNFTISASTTVLRWNGAGLATFTGFTGGVGDRFLLVVNATSAQTLKLTNLNVGSSSANQILNTSSKDINLTGANSSALLKYDGTTSVWRMITLFSTTVDYSITYASGLTLSNSLSGTTGAFTTGVVAQGTGAHYRTTLSAGTSFTCGTSPGGTATDSAGKVTIGTTSGGNCTVTFATTYTNPPMCIVQFEDSATRAASSYSTSATQLLVTGASDGKVFDYFCVGLI